MTRANERGKMMLLIAATACFWGSLYLYVPILSPYAEFVGAPLTMVGLIVSSYGFTQLVLRIPVGLWSDRIGRRKPFIMWGFVIAAASAAWLALAGEAWSLLGARALTGVSATMWVIITVLFSSYFSTDRAGYAMSLIMFTTSISQLVSTLLGGLIAEAWGWTAPFWAACATGCIGFAIAGRIKEIETRKVGLSLDQLVRVGRERSLWLIALLAAFYQFNSFVTVYGFTPNYAVLLGASKAELGWLSLISTLPTAVASLASGGMLARRFSETQMVVSGLIIVAVCTYVIPFSHTMTALYVTQGVSGIGRGIIFPVLMGLSIKAVPDEKRGTAMGFFQSIYALGMFGGPAISGAIAEQFGLSGAFWTSAAVLVVASAAGAYWLPKAFPAHKSPRTVAG